ncbi:hypothetical protein JW796_00870 [Candidatus Dojkabacteria bacterium]|nr:hypothetical protein [Candidatus Dojkabacteria bacterium]
MRSTKFRRFYSSICIGLLELPHSYVITGLGEIDKDVVIQTALVHDMGNIVKFNMSFMSEAFEPEGVAYWTGVKEEFIEKYGSDEHEVTQKIIEEMKVPERIVEVVTALGFAKAKESFETKDFRVKICLYSDQRVTPSGVASLERRMEEGYKRFLGRKDLPEGEIGRFPVLADYLRKIELQIIDHCRIKPEGINDEAIKSTCLHIKDFEIATHLTEF